MKIFTVGHSTRTHEELYSLLAEHEVDFLLDVRSYPTSKYCPQWNASEVAQDLPGVLDYGWLPELGGRRKALKDSINTAWRNASFRGYADYMQTKEFKDGIDDLLEISKDCNVAIMCAEAVWWRCHRHMIADYLTGLELAQVYHIMDNGADIHKLKDIAVVGDNTVTYPAK